MSSDWTFEHPDTLQVLGKIGEGAFGTVVKALGQDGKEYALKRIRNYASMPGKIQTPYAKKICREVETLSLLQGKSYIVPLVMVYLSEDKKDVYMLMPFIQFDLQNVIEVKMLEEEKVKWIAYQILCGINHVHEQKLMHRDLTLKNILISEVCDTYLADFGLARAHEVATDDITLDVVTLEYRAPELLLQYKKYDTRVDMWSIGCMIAEMFLRRRLLVPQRRDVPCQLLKLVQVFGKPDIEFVRQHASPSAVKFFEHILARFDALEKSEEGQRCFDPPIAVQLEQAGASPAAIEVITGLLQFDFRKRLTARQCMQMPWFSQDEEYKELEGVTVGAPPPAAAAIATGGSSDETTATAAGEAGAAPVAQIPQAEQNGTTTAEPGSPTMESAVTYNYEDGEIIEANESLMHLQRADIDGLRAFMESRAVAVPNLVRSEYSSAASVAATLT